MASCCGPRLYIVCVCLAGQVRTHREALESERSTWRRERDSLQEELGRLRGVVSSKVKLNLQSPTDSLETSMKKVTVWGEGGGRGRGECTRCHLTCVL